jgi:nucleoid DNA-binding protein
MQYTHVELYNDVSVKNDIPLHKVKFVGDIVFNAINKNLKEPDSIILKIKHIGKFFMRKNRLEREINSLKRRLTQADNEIERMSLIVKLARLEKRNEEYTEYIVDKHKIKELRYGSQEALEPDNEEEDI